MKIPFYRYENTVDEHSSVSDVLDGDSVNQVDLLEEEFCEYIGADYSIATSHGTSALHLAMLALDLKRGDKVVCSVNSHPNLPEVIRHFDAEPVFLEIEENFYNINLDKLEEYLQDNKSKKLKAVLVTHIAGITVDLDRLYNMGKLYNVKIVEDACDALGATYKGNKIGSTGADITCFNFSSHLRESICNGGMLVTNNKKIIERARLLNNHAIVKNENALEYIYDVIDIGNDYSLSQIDAAYIRMQVKKQDKSVLRQQEIAKIYTDSLEGTDHITLPVLDGVESPNTLYIVKVDKNRDSFALELKNLGISTGVHYIPLHLITYYKTKYALKVNAFPVALRSFQQVMSLPIYASMTDKEIKYVIESVKKVAETRV
ncbi:MAG: DegT/DnrJ/EryC1/StrS aminotransferase family protein [Sulfurimonas sp.]|nr:DegT/DnrJ/EryC1/StrS aminotransferase family protein [Sulfurimonas sp.]